MDRMELASAIEFLADTLDNLAKKVGHPDQKRALEVAALGVRTQWLIARGSDTGAERMAESIFDGVSEQIDIGLSDPALQHRLDVAKSSAFFAAQRYLGHMDDAADEKLKKH